MFDKLSERELNVITLGVAFLFTVLVLVYFSMPKWQEIQLTNHELTQKKAEIENLKAQQNREKVKETVAQLSNQIRQQRDKLPVGPESSKIIGKLAEIQEDTGAMIVETKCGQSVQEPGAQIKNLVSFPLSIKIQGSYEQVKLFIDLLQQYDRIGQIESVKLEKKLVPNGTVSEPLIEENISLKLYALGAGDWKLNANDKIPFMNSTGKPDPFKLGKAGTVTNGTNSLGNAINHFGTGTPNGTQDALQSLLQRILKTPDVSSNVYKTN